MKEDLHYKSSMMRRGQFMSEVTKVRRAESVKTLLAKIKHPSAPTSSFFL
jgi:hypothetical protein